MAYSKALDILGRDSADLATPWCRSAASMALWGYALAAQKLGRMNELHLTLARWRPIYLGWIKAPVTTDEGRYLEWFEEVLGHSRASP